MTLDEFWKLIDTVDRTTLDKGEGYEDDAVAPLVDALSALERAQVESFEEYLANALFALDGKAYADNAGDSGQSGDGFLYARCYVVAKGRQFYERVLQDPRKMPKSIDQWLEPLLFVSAQAWAQATGNDQEDWDYEPRVSWETGSNAEQW